MLFTIARVRFARGGHPMAVAQDGSVREFCVLAHAERGSIDTFLTRTEAIYAMHDFLQREPDSRRDDLWVETFRLVVAEPAER